MDVDNQPHLVEIVAALKEITAKITAATSMTEAINDLAKIVAEILPPHVQTGVMLVAQGEPAAYASTGAPLELLDESSHAGGDGPCMEAIRSRDIVLSQNLAQETRWPAWTALARERSVASVLSYPFDVDTLTLGALGLYTDRADGFGGDIPIVAMLIADHASLLLRAQLRYFNQPGDPSEAPASDSTVEHAVGIVMAQRGCSPDQALRHLHEAATHLGVGLPVVAQRLVQTVSVRGDQASGPS